MRKTGKWTQIEYSKMRGLMPEADAKFPKRGQQYWEWLGGKMGRTAKACRSKEVHMRNVVNGVARSRKKTSTKTTEADGAYDRLLNVLVNHTERIDAIEKMLKKLEQVFQHKE